jgi:hypothetical protein
MNESTPTNPAPQAAALLERFDDVVSRLDRLEQTLELLVGQRQVKEQYCTAEVAEILGKAEFTVREWCRLGRVRARKRRCGRGPAGEWTIAHDELVRIQNHGLLPGAGY